MTINADLKEGLMRGAVTAGVAYGTVQLLSPASAATKVKIGPINMSLGMAFPLAVGAGSLLASYTHDFVLSHIPQSERYATLESAAINAGLAGGAGAGLVYLSNTDKVTASGAVKMAALGIGSELAGNKIYESFVRPALRV
jgi:ABC-type sugar transport system substrate-binding protein